jgi:formylglycine-generating enzyme required for sulfatase activity
LSGLLFGDRELLEIMKNSSSTTLPFVSQIAGKIRLSKGRMARLFCALGFASALIPACTHDWDALTPYEFPAADAVASDVVAVPPPLVDSSVPDATLPAVDCESGMVGVRSGTSAFCIDAKEVTRLDYGRFLANFVGGRNIRPLPSLAGLPMACASVNRSSSDLFPISAWSDVYLLAASNSSDAGVSTDAGGGSAPAGSDLPVTYVDWCDAQTYCLAAGKRLCGPIGGGAPLASNAPDLLVPARNEWLAACTADGARAYPYGSTFDPQACRGAEFPPNAGDGGAVDGGVSQPEPVGSAARCQGGVPGLYDMVGNVFEWEDARSLDGERTAVVRGGSHFVGNASCGTSSVQAWDSRLPTVGFRCCASPRGTALVDAGPTDAALDAPNEAGPSDAGASTDADAAPGNPMNPMNPSQ